MFLAKFLTQYEKDSFSIGKFFRKRRLRRFQDQLEEIYQKKKKVRIIDIGGSFDYWKLLPESYYKKFNISIVIVNIEKKIKAKDKKKFIFADATTNLWDKIDQNKFDIMHSNSVIEHVGTYKKMQKFAENFLNFHGKYFVQTPNYFFPIEPHFMTPFFHWMPLKIQVWLVYNFQLGFMKKAKNKSDAIEIIKTCNLLKKKQFSLLFPNAFISTERFLIFNKSLIAIK